MDLKMTWVEGPDQLSVFEDLGTKIESSPDNENHDLNLDVVVAYKTTTLRFVADSLLSSIKVDNQFLSWSLNFVSCALLMCLSLKGTVLAELVENEFRDVYPFFEKNYGEMVVKKNAVSHLPHAHEVLSMLMRRGVLKEDDDHYYVVGHILKNIELSKK